MTVSEENNGYGQKVYKAEVPANVEGIIFNGGGNQTVDIKEKISDGAQWYAVDEKDDKGNYKVELVGGGEEATTAAPTVAPTTKASTEYTYFFVPKAADVTAGYTFKLNLNDEAGTDPQYWHQFTMEKTDETVDGVAVYKVTFTADYTNVNAIQFQSWDNNAWKDEVVVNKGKKTALADLNGKLVKADGSVNEYKVDNGEVDFNDIVETTAPATAEPTEAPTTAAPTTEATTTEATTKTISVGVIEYLNLNAGSYQVHYWGGKDGDGDANVTSTGKTEQKSVGSSYWGNAAQKFNMYTASIPKDVTGFCIRNGNTWFTADGNGSATQTKAYVFEYGGNYHAVYA
jgi:hypothetical protein